MSAPSGIAVMSVVTPSVEHMKMPNTTVTQADSTTRGLRTYRVSLASCNEEAHLADAPHLGFADGPCLNPFPVAAILTIDIPDDPEETDRMLDLLDDVIHDATTTSGAITGLRFVFPACVAEVTIPEDVDPDATMVRDYEITGEGFPYRAYNHDFGSEGISTRTIEAD